MATGKKGRQKGEGVKDDQEKRVRVPLKLRGKTDEWIREHIPEGKRNRFIELAVEKEIDRMEVAMGRAAIYGLRQGEKG